jgi:hypothetical protein
MKYYCIKLHNLPISSIHKASLDNKFDYDDQSKHSAFLNINGRLCQNLKFAICETKEQAIELYEYWKPQLENREYGQYFYTIESSYANKWQQKYLISNHEKLTILFSTQPKCNVPKRASKQRLPKTHKGLYVVELITKNNEKYYVSSFKNNGGLKAVSLIADANLYKNKAFCLNKIKNVNMKNIKMLYVLPILEQQFLEIQCHLLN